MSFQRIEMNRFHENQDELAAFQESLREHSAMPPSEAADGSGKRRDVDPKTRKKATAIVESLDLRRQQKKMSKAELARRLGKHPASFRRLFTTTSNPELLTLIQIANALDADIKIVPQKKRSEYVPM